MNDQNPHRQNGRKRRRRRQPAHNSAAHSSHLGRTHRSKEACNDPHRLARAILSRIGRDAHGRIKLRSYANLWWEHDGRRYVWQDQTDFETRITAEIKTLFDEWDASDSQGHRLKVTQALVSNVLNALRSEPGVRVHKGLTQPIWLGVVRHTNFLAFQNGLLDLNELTSGNTPQLRPHTPEWFSPVCLPYDYEPTASAPGWEQFLNWMFNHDPELIRVTQEWFGYCVVMDTSLEKMLIAVGLGSNGKSVLLKTLERMLGRDNVSAVPLEDFANEFRLAATVGKLANIVSEIGDVTRLPEGKLKQFTSGELMSFNRKYRDPIEANATARLVFATNKIPRFSDKTEGVYRRLIILPCDRQIREHERDQHLAEKLQQELPGILNWALRGLIALNKQGGFTRAAKSEAALEDHRSSSDPERKFLHEECCAGGSIETVTLFRRYQAWCRDHGNTPVNDTEFGRVVKIVYPDAKRRRDSTGNRPYRYFGISLASQASQDSRFFPKAV